MNFVKAEPQAATTKKYNDWESINDDNNKINRKSHTYYMFPISDNVQCPLAMMERSSARSLLLAVQIKDFALVLGAALQPYGGLVCRRSSADFCRAEKKLLKRKSLARSFCSDFTRELMSSDLFAGRFSMTLSAVLVVDLVNSI